MAARKFRFVSPGVFLREIDRSQIPAIPEGIGPVIIGRTRKGPALKPYKVRSMEEFNRVFGAPMPGNQGEDSWRDGTHLLAESYAPYAAKAHFAAGTDSPVTVVRLAGAAGDDADSNFGEPGWSAANATGLFLFTSGGLGGEVPGEATREKRLQLAAIFYGATGSFEVNAKGNRLETVDTIETTSSKPVKLDGTNQLTLQLKDGDVLKDVIFNISNIRDSFNTNPVMTNSLLTSPSAESLAGSYWLGETFDDVYKNLVNNQPSGHAICAMTIPMQTLMEDFRSQSHGLTAARTGWIFGQSDLTTTDAFEPAELRKLFRFVALHEGQDAMKELIISIEDIRLPRDGAINRFGTFAVSVKRILPTRLEEIERFDDCNLNPNSANYVVRMIGDQYLEWSPTERRNKLYGGNPNISEYIRIDPASDLETNPAPELVPFGFYGPIKPETISMIETDATQDADGEQIFETAGRTELGSFTWIKPANNQVSYRNITVNGAFFVAETGGSAANVSGITGSFVWPSAPLINSASSDMDYMLGVSPFNLNYVSGGNEMPSTLSQNKGYIDYLRRLPSYDVNSMVADQDSGVSRAAEPTEYSFKFSLEDVVMVPSPQKTRATIETARDVSAVYHRSGSRNVTTVANGPEGDTRSWAAYCAHDPNLQLRTLLDVCGGFMVPLAGGFDGVNIVEPNPFNMSTRDGCLGPDATTSNSYAFASVDRAIELIRDPEFIEHNLALMPGITNETLTTKLVNACEQRGDSMAIIDLPNVYVPPSQKECTTFADRVPTSGRPEATAAKLVKRQLNSSYGATYYPWVKIKDERFNRDVWVPPSVVALGVMAYTEKTTDVWFAPAGFNRGGLNSGNAGLPVMQVSSQLLSKDRDVLYRANINPIASFVSEGIVVFGQKTLQSTQSALDRINVRRLLIFVKKMVSRVANNLLFDPNVQATWNRFTNQVVPQLENIKTRFGLSDFKVVLDSTTTTPDLVDRNVMYAKVFLKPARAIEFIAVDFIITNTGASFDD